MKRLLIVLFLLIPVTVAADGGTCGNAPNLDAFAFETVTVSSAAIGFTAATYLPAGAAPAEMALVYTESDSLRWRADGSDPTGSVGHLEAASSKFLICGKVNIASFKMIRTSTDVTVSVTYFR